jgi:hypothetical protein
MGIAQDCVNERLDLEAAAVAKQAAADIHDLIRKAANVVVKLGKPAEDYYVVYELTRAAIAAVCRGRAGTEQLQEASIAALDTALTEAARTR